MVRAVSLFERPFVIESERSLPKEEQTRWFHRPLTQRERAEIIDEYTRAYGKPGDEKEERRHANGSTLLAAVRYALLRVENFRDENNQDIHVPTNRNDRQAWDGFLDRIPYDVLTELGGAIFKSSSMGVEAVGESSGASTSAATTSSVPAQPNGNSDASASAS
jgi:hypothetical protein